MPETTHRESTTTNHSASPRPPPTTKTPAPLPVIGPNITNVVCGLNLNCRFDLRHIAQSARNVVYNPKRFPAAVLRLREPKATALVFEGGKLQVLGTKSVEDARLASRKFARMLQKLGYKPRLDDFVVQNIVGNADARMLVRLEGLHLHHEPYVKYEPELFPGLVYSVMQPKMKVLVFAKGKLVFLGAKRKEDLDRALELLYPVLVEFRRT